MMILLRDMFGQKATYLRHEVISRCISGLVKIRTSYLKSHFTIFIAFVLRCCIINIKAICRHDALPYN